MSNLLLSLERNSVGFYCHSGTLRDVFLLATGFLFRM
jgi:hypothetical protein